MQLFSLPGTLLCYCLLLAIELLNQYCLLRFLMQLLLPLFGLGLSIASYWSVTMKTWGNAVMIIVVTIVIGEQAVGEVLEICA